MFLIKYIINKKLQVRTLKKESCNLKNNNNIELKAHIQELNLTNEESHQQTTCLTT